jgi:FPC/CPF motif-containing protein YcgG
VTPDLTAVGTRLCELTEPRSVEWEQDAVDRFTRRMLDRERLFPCVFGVDAVKRNTLRCAFIPRGEGIGPLAEAMTEFVAAAPVLGKRTSLVTFFEPGAGETTLADYRERFWRILQDLHEADSEPWPPDISVDTESPTWEFCFGGMPMFVVANTPSHERRVSRYFESLAITFQPRFVFDDIGEDSPQGQNARKIIRGRLREYDALSPTPELGSFGAPGNREWAQYFLDDDNAPLASDSRCPFHHTKGTK